MTVRARSRKSRKPSGLIPYIDLSDEAETRQRRIYTLHLRDWWPHPLHARMRVEHTHEGMLFICGCGSRLLVGTSDAEYLGIL